MKTIRSYVKFSQEKRKEYAKLQDEKERLIAQYDKRIQDLREHVRAKSIIERIAKALKRKFGYAKAEVLGPFGLGCKVSIHIYRKKDDDIANALSITFEYQTDEENDSLVYVDYSANTGEFSKGSIGEMNGFNHPLVDITHLSLDELNDLILKMNEVEA
jgi:hypothetical protein